MRSLRQLVTANSIIRHRVLKHETVKNLGHIGVATNTCADMRCRCDFELGHVDSPWVVFIDGEHIARIRVVGN